MNLPTTSHDTAADTAADTAPADAALSRPWLAGVEVLGAALGVLAIIWKLWDPIPHGPLRTLCSAGLYVVVITIVSISFLRLRDTPAQLGLLPRNWHSGWASMGGFTVAALGGILLAAVLLPHAKLHIPGHQWLIQYIPAVLVQQLLLQCFLNNRLYALGGNLTPPWRLRLAVIGSTAVFIALHAPNPALMAFVCISGLFWTWHFRHHLNLAALCISHFILGLAAMTFLGEAVLLRLRVGLSAYRALTGQ